MFAKLLCRLGRHKRSSSRLFRGSNGIMKSRCRSCGEPMVHDRETGTWMIAETPQVQA